MQEKDTFGKAHRRCYPVANFTLDEMKRIAAQLPRLPDMESILERIFLWTKGNPLLVNTLLNIYMEEKQKEDDAKSEIIIDEIIQRDKLDERVKWIMDRKKLEDVFFTRNSDRIKLLLEKEGELPPLIRTYFPSDF